MEFPAAEVAAETQFYSFVSDGEIARAGEEPADRISPEDDHASSSEAHSATRVPPATYAEGLTEEGDDGTAIAHRQHEAPARCPSCLPPATCAEGLAA